MPPESFGPYEVGGLLGRGGMGEVHRAYDTVRQRTVALKRLRPERLDDDHSRARFLLECRAAAQLSEPHIIPIHDFGEIDGRLFLDMRLIEGEDLQEVLTRNGPMPPDLAVEVVSQVAAALDAAHAAGLVHRDVKPSNVLLVRDGRRWHCYLADFGVAAAAGGGGALTLDGTTVGTIDYLAPERLLGGPTDHRVDIYSLACLLFEALTGHPPFSADEPAAMLHAHLHLAPPRPSRSAPLVPVALDEVVVGGMAKDPEERPASAGEFAAAAAAALEHGTPAQRPAPDTVVAGVPPSAARTAATGRSTAVVSSGGAGGAYRHPGGRRRAGLVPSLLLAGVLVLAGGAVAFGVDLLGSVEPTQVTAEPAAAVGDDPFLPSGGGPVPSPAGASASSSTGPVVASGPPDDRAGAATPPAAPDVLLSGDAVGLYGGTGTESCQPDRLSDHLSAHPGQGRAWAGAQGIAVDDIRSFLSGLTPVVLRADTAVTNHGYRDGRAVPVQSVLQVGTAVLVDDRGTPRVRCSCGNPLDVPAARHSVRYVGATWAGLGEEPVVVVRPARRVVDVFVLVLVDRGRTEVVERPRGTDGGSDRPAPEAVAVEAAAPVDRDRAEAAAGGGTTARPEGAPTLDQQSGPTDPESPTPDGPTREAAEPTEGSAVGGDTSGGDAGTAAGAETPEVSTAPGPATPVGTGGVDRPDVGTDAPVEGDAHSVPPSDPAEPTDAMGPETAPVTESEAPPVAPSEDVTTPGDPAVDDDRSTDGAPEPEVTEAGPPTDTDGGP